MTNTGFESKDSDIYLFPSCVSVHSAHQRLGCRREMEDRSNLFSLIWWRSHVLGVLWGNNKNMSALTAHLVILKRGNTTQFENLRRYVAVKKKEQWVCFGLKSGDSKSDSSPFSSRNDSKSSGHERLISWLIHLKLNCWRRFTGKILSLFKNVVFLFVTTNVELVTIMLTKPGGGGDAHSLGPLLHVSAVTPPSVRMWYK